MTQDIGESGRIRCSTEYAPRQIIENQLLVALDDKSKTAIVASKDDLELLIYALLSVCEDVPDFHKFDQMRIDFEQLRDSAFPHNA